jgi:ribosomal protein S2
MLSIEQLLNYNGHVGSNSCKFNTQMGLFILGQLGNLMLFDLRISILFLRRSISLLRILNLNVARRQVVFIGCHFSVDNFLKRANQFFEYKFEPLFGLQVFRPYFLLTTWIRGCFSNFKKIRKFICYIKLILAFAKKYTKDYSEYIAGKLLSKPYSIMRAPSFLRKRWSLMLGGHFSGFDSIEFFPAFAINFKLSNKVWFTSECCCVDLPNISIVDSFSDPRGVSFPIPGNENSIQYLYLILFLFINNIKISILSYHLRFFSKILFEFEKYPILVKYNLSNKTPIKKNILNILSLKFPSLQFFFENFSLTFRNFRECCFYLKIKRFFFFTYFNHLLSRFDTNYQVGFQFKYRVYFLILFQFFAMPILILRKIFTKISHYFRSLKYSLNFSFKKYFLNFSNQLNPIKHLNLLNFRKNTFKESLLVRQKRKGIQYLTKHQQFFFFRNSIHFQNLPCLRFSHIIRNLNLQSLILFMPSRSSSRNYNVKHKFALFSEYSLMSASKFKLKKKKNRYLIGALRYKYIKLLSLRQFFPKKFFKKHVYISRKSLKALRLVSKISSQPFCINNHIAHNFLLKLRMRNRFDRRIQSRHKLTLRFLRLAFRFDFFKQKKSYMYIARALKGKPIILNEIRRVREKKTRKRKKARFRIIKPTKKSNKRFSFNKRPLFNFLCSSFALQSKFINSKKLSQNKFFNMGYLPKREFLWDYLNNPSTANQYSLNSFFFFSAQSRRRPNFRFFYKTPTEQSYNKSLLSFRFFAASYLRAFSLNLTLRKNNLNLKRVGKWDLLFRRFKRTHAKYYKLYRLRYRKVSKFFFKHKIFPYGLPLKTKLSLRLFRLLKLITLFFILRKISLH